MSDQLFSVPDLPSEGVCDWCGAPAVGRVVVEPARFGYEEKGDMRLRVMKKQAITALACPVHRKMVDDAWAAKEAEREEILRKRRAQRKAA